MSLYSFHRENGSFQRNISKQRSRFHSVREKDFIYSTYEQKIRNLYCLDSTLYHIPGNLHVGQFEAPPYATEFCTAGGSEHVFSVADEDGHVALYSSLHSPSKSGPLVPLHSVHAHENAIFDIAWIPKEHILVTASGDKTASIWDMVKGKATGTLAGHSCSLRAINVSKHNTSLLVTGSRDGNALVWDRRSNKAIMRIQDAHVLTSGSTPKRRRRVAMSDQSQLGNDSQQTVSCALFQDAHTIVTAGTRDGTLKIWDLRKLKQMKKTTAKNKVQPIEILPYPGSSLRRRGYTCLTFDSSNTNLYASCTDDSVYHYNLATSCSNGRYSGHTNSSFYVRTALSHDDKLLLSGSCNNKAYIWNADGKCGLPKVRLTSRMMSEVTAVAWCPIDVTHLVTCSDECVVRLWKMSYGKLEVSEKTDLDGKAETVENDVLGCKCGCDFSPISVISRTPVPTSSEAFSPISTKSDATPQKPPKDTNSILTTPTRKLVQTSVTSLFTPTRSANASPSLNTVTPSRGSSNAKISPESTAEHHTMQANTDDEVKPGTRKAFKSLDSEMSSCEIDDKENVPVDTEDSFMTPKKNWLLELTKKRKSEGEKSASKRQRRSLSSPVSTSSKDKESPRHGMAISSYFRSGSLF